MRRRNGTDRREGILDIKKKDMKKHNPLLLPENDPMGAAIADYSTLGEASRLRVFSPMFDEDEIPVETLFRDVEDMPEIEREALGLARGRTLDVGAGAGCHSLALQARGIRVEAIDISPLAVKTMRARGVRHVCQKDLFDVRDPYDTILMLMNGIGIVGTCARLPQFFHLLDEILLPGGQLLCDSTDIRYVFDDDEPIDQMINYYGELVYKMQYKEIVGNSFPWLYIDADTLGGIAATCGYHLEVAAKGDNDSYLAIITKKG